MENESNITDYYKKTAMFWSDMIAMMSSKPTTLSAVGPLRTLSSNLKKITNELTEANKEIVGFNNFLIEYYKQLADTWSVAQKDVASKVSKLSPNEEGTEAYKRIWIDIFENNFTGLFDSKKTEGLKGAIQRILPGGKKGYTRERLDPAFQRKGNWSTDPDVLKKGSY